MSKEKPLGMRIGESAFCTGYLAFALIAGLVFLSASQTAGVWAHTCGIMTLVLGCGDAFHLVPRILINLHGSTQDPEAGQRRSFWLEVGNLVSSISMTVFYLLLYLALWQMTHPDLAATMSSFETGVFVFLCALAAVRIALCLFSQNKWFDGEGSQQWSIYRNVPFVAMGVITVWYLVAWYGLLDMAVLVCLSFACYMGVVLGARQRPMLGMLMIPKTICYIWLLSLLLARL